MMHENFNSDLFIERTKKIIEQYKENFKSNITEFYDVTLAVNCLYGLLMMPSKKFYYHLSEAPAKKVLAEKITESEFSFSVKSPENLQAQISFKELVISIRNGLGHWKEGKDCKVEFKTDENDKISEVIICGTIEKNKKTIESRFNVSESSENSIEKFVNLICDRT